MVPQRVSSVSHICATLVSPIVSVDSSRPVYLPRLRNLRRSALYLSSSREQHHRPPDHATQRATASKRCLPARRARAMLNQDPKWESGLTHLPVRWKIKMEKVGSKSTSERWQEEQPRDKDPRDSLAFEAPSPSIPVAKERLQWSSSRLSRFAVLSLVATISVLLRLWPLMLADGTERLMDPNTDSGAYVELAHGLRSGCGFARVSNGKCLSPEVNRTPGYPAFLSLMPDLSDRDRCPDAFVWSDDLCARRLRFSTLGPLSRARRFHIGCARCTEHRLQQ